MLNENKALAGDDTMASLRKVLDVKFEIISQLGRGGMASVYKAVQKTLDKTVALKIVHPHLTLEETFIQRFFREARIGASLNHPNIVHMYDLGNENNIYYLSMEYVEGTDLKTLLRSNGVMTERELYEIAVQLVSALSFAHKAGVVHRDIKSANILISANNQVKITDFGIASAASETKLTQTGSLMGTLDYMSPEQAVGKKVDYKTDYYSLGMVFYECLTGLLPLKSENQPATLLRIMTEEPEHINKYIGNDSRFGKLIMWLLEKNPEKRPESILEAFNECFPNPIGANHNYDLKSPDEETVNSGVESYGTEPEYEESEEVAGNEIIDLPVNDIALLFDEEADLTIDTIIDKMIPIRGGQFIMGSDTAEHDCKPAHLVILTGFYMGKCPVTVKEWNTVMREERKINAIDEFLPVVDVNYSEVMKFIDKLNTLLLRKNDKRIFRLPTEAEWEYAARGGNQSKGYKYAGSNAPAEVAWYKGNCSRLQRPGLLKPNELGLYDMSGNVWEWCSDWYSKSYYRIAPTNNPEGPWGSLLIKKRIIRGGSWFSELHFLSPLIRMCDHHTFSDDDLGFRLVMSERV